MKIKNLETSLMLISEGKGISNPINFWSGNFIKLIPNIFIKCENEIRIYYRLEQGHKKSIILKNGPCIILKLEDGGTYSKNKSTTFELLRKFNITNWYSNRFLIDKNYIKPLITKEIYKENQENIKYLLSSNLSYFKKYTINESQFNNPEGELNFFKEELGDLGLIWGASDIREAEIKIKTYLNTIDIVELSCNIVVKYKTYYSYRIGGDDSYSLSIITECNFSNISYLDPYLDKIINGIEKIEKSNVYRDSGYHDCRKDLPEGFTNELKDDCDVYTELLRKKFIESYSYESHFNTLLNVYKSIDTKPIGEIKLIS